MPLTARRASSEPSGTGLGPGGVVIAIDAIGTGIFVASALTAAIVFTSAAQWLGSITAITLFFIGIVAFLWAFWNAVQRSRGEQVSVSQLYLLAGGVAPRSVRISMLTMLAIQIVVGLATALSRTQTSDGQQGTSLALGVLVPMFGLGMNGLWAAFHGTYAVRDDAERGDDPTDAPSVGSIGKDGEHG